MVLGPKPVTEACRESRSSLNCRYRLDPSLPPPFGEVSHMQGDIIIIEPSVRASHKEGLRFWLGVEVL